MFGNRYFPPSYFADAYFGTTGEADPNAMRGTAAGVASVTGSLTGVTSGAFVLEADTGVITLTGSDISFQAPNRIGGTVRKRRRGKRWDYDTAFAARELEQRKSEVFPIAPKPAPPTPTFDSLLATYKVEAPSVPVRATRPHWRIEDYQAALVQKRRQQEFERLQRDLEDEELLLLLEAA
jgi:hypothetical protein